MKVYTTHQIDPLTVNADAINNRTAASNRIQRKKVLAFSVIFPNLLHVYKVLLSIHTQS